MAKVMFMGDPGQLGIILKKKEHICPLYHCPLAQPLLLIWVVPSSFAAGRGHQEHNLSHQTKGNSNSPLTTHRPWATNFTEPRFSLCIHKTELSMVLAISKAFNLSAIIFYSIFYNIIFILKIFLIFF